MNKMEQKSTNNENKETINEIKILKQILIAQLVMSGVSIRDIVKITGMSTQTIYTFLPKNLGKKKNE